MRGGGIYLGQEAITRDEVVSTWSRSQSYEGSRYIPGAGATHLRGVDIYLEQEPIT